MKEASYEDDYQKPEYDWPVYQPPVKKKGDISSFVGQWEGEMEMPPSFPFTLTLQQTGERLTGSITTRMQESAPIEAVVTSGNRIEFAFETPMGSINLKGTLQGDRIVGTWSAGEMMTGSWKATRKV